MRIIALPTLKSFWDKHPEFSDAINPTLAWYRHAIKADWASPSELKLDFNNASILKDSRVVFNICGNKYRLIVKINFSASIIYVRFIGTHKEYDAIDAETV